MNFYKIERPEHTVGWDEAAAMVVVAASPSLARKLAAANAGPEGKAVWLDPAASTLTNESRSPARRVVLTDVKRR